MPKKIYNFIYNYMISEHTPYNVRLINMVTGCALLACFLGAIVSSFKRAPIFATLTLIFGMLVIIGLAYYSNKTKKYIFASTIMVGFGCFIYMPVGYFYTGGIRSGLMYYYIFCISLAFIIFRTSETIAFLSVFFLIFAGCIFSSFYNPGLVADLTNWQEYFDKTASIIICGVVVGLMMKFQKMVYMQEKTKAESSLKVKSDFLAAVSHEIRTPLNAIIGLTELEMLKSLPPKTLSNLGKIYNSGNTLMNIINDILDTSKIESGRFSLNLASYTLSEMISDATSLNMIRIGSKPIKFNIFVDENLPAVLLGDELRVKQIINNLLSNAFKYTLEGEVNMRITSGSNDSGFLLNVSISDTGIGIKPEDVNNLFREYSQVHSGSNLNIEGTGLGLAISRSLVEMMGGEIVVKSTFGEGSNFTFYILQEVQDPTPIGPETAEALQNFKYYGDPSKKYSQKSNMSYARVLVVDDVMTNLDVTKGMLMRYGMRVDTASGGYDAIDILRSNEKAYDAIFMDHMMPDIDGIETVHIIRNEFDSEHLKNIPIIALTANALEGYEELFLNNGFQAFLPKPINSVQLDGILHAWIKKKPFPEVNYISSEEQSSNGSPDVSLLKGLLEAVELYDVIMMDKYVSALESHDYDEEGRGLVEWLRANTENLEYEAIKSCLHDQIMSRGSNGGENSAN